MLSNETSTQICTKKQFKVTYHLPGEDFVSTEVNHHRILFGGDQLTVCRSCVAKFACSHDDKHEERYRCEGLILVVEDWYARLTLMKVKQLIC